MFRALLIDDEPPARDLLRRLLAAHASQVEIVGEARSVSDAADKCARLRPDLLFLDVQMPREDGFALLPRLTPPVPAVIFVTAYDQFAVRAFDVNAVDYLLKPIVPERLARALAKLVAGNDQPANASDAAASLTAPLQPGDMVFLRSDNFFRTAPVSALTHIEAEENYTRVHFADGAPMLVRRPMGEWEKLLPDMFFVRVDRSLIVNRAAVQRLEVVSRDIAHVHLAGCRDPLVLARRASLRLRQALEGNT